MSKMYRAKKVKACIKKKKRKEKANVLVLESRQQ